MKESTSSFPETSSNEYMMPCVTLSLRDFLLTSKYKHPDQLNMLLLHLPCPSKSTLTEAQKNLVLHIPNSLRNLPKERGEPQFPQRCHISQTLVPIMQL